MIKDFFTGAMMALLIVVCALSFAFIVVSPLLVSQASGVSDWYGIGGTVALLCIVGGVARAINNEAF